MNRKRKTYLDTFRTFLPTDQHLYWTEQLVAFTNDESPANVAARTEEALQAEARRRGFQPIRTAPAECYVPLQRALRRFLDPLDTFLSGLGATVDRNTRIKWRGLARFPDIRPEYRAQWVKGPMGALFRKLGEVQRLSAEGSRDVRVFGQFTFDVHGQQYLFSPSFDWLPLAFAVAAGDLLNPVSDVLVRRCKCALYEDVRGGCGQYLTQYYGPGSTKGRKNSNVDGHALTDEECDELTERKKAIAPDGKVKNVDPIKWATARRTLLRSFRGARKKQ